jgi:hypothetical protein
MNKFNHLKTLKFGVIELTFQGEYEKVMVF